MDKQVELILQEIERQQDGLIDTNGNFYSREDEGAYHALSDLESFIATTFQKEPVSEDLEKAAVEAFKNIVDEDRNSFLEIFKAGAQWKEQQMMAKFVEGANYVLNVLYNIAYKEDWISHPKEGVRRFFEVYKQLKK